MNNLDITNNYSNYISLFTSTNDFEKLNDIVSSLWIQYNSTLTYKDYNDYLNDFIIKYNIKTDDKSLLFLNDELILKQNIVKNILMQYVNSIYDIKYKSSVKKETPNTSYVSNIQSCKDEALKKSIMNKYIKKSNKEDDIAPFDEAVKVKETPKEVSKPKEPVLSDVKTSIETPEQKVQEEVKEATEIISVENSKIIIKENSIICPICQKEMKIMSNTHLAIHNMNNTEFVKLYPEYKVYHKKYYDKRNEKSAIIKVKKPEAENKIKPSIDIHKEPVSNSLSSEEDTILNNKEEIMQTNHSSERKSNELIMISDSFKNNLLNSVLAEIYRRGQIGEAMNIESNDIQSVLKIVLNNNS